jgi:Fe-Mn family superoxide dismutase
MCKQLSFFLFFVTALFSYEVQNFSHLISMPGFSDDLLKMHLKLYEGYVKNSNELLMQLNSLAHKGKTSSLEYGALKRRFGWEFDGMRLHELYFRNLGGDGEIPKNTALTKALIHQYGSIEEWKKEFVATGLMRGIGWVILYRDQEALINAWINEHDEGHLVRATPLLIMDVFEHAYMPQFGLDRAAYIDRFFANLNWKVVEERFTFSNLRAEREEK